MAALRKKPKPPRPKRMPARQSKPNTKAGHSLIRCVIFDLDDTLYDCFRQRVRVCHRNAARAMVEAGLHASVEAVYRERLRAFRHDPMLRHIDDVVCRKFKASDPEKVRHAAREAYFNCPVDRLTLFRGSLPLLRYLRAKGVHSFVVSFGEPAIQHAKAKALGLEGNSLIDGILYADRDKLLTKRPPFARSRRRPACHRHRSWWLATVP